MRNRVRETSVFFCVFVLAGLDFSFSDIFITLQQEDLSQVST